MYHALTPSPAIGDVYVGDLPADIRRLIETPLASMPGQTRDFVERVLAFAAEAQQTIADQKSRIEHLETLSMTDELTGLLNRRGFDNALNRALGNAKRHDEQGLLVAIDLDGFKPVNDSYGHAAGDALLRFIAKFLDERVRTTDYLGRIGGDEFAILMVNCDLAPARHRALEIRDQLNEAVAPLGCGTLPVRASFGIAPYDASSSAETVQHMADVAMYHDKRRRACARIVAAE